MLRRSLLALLILAPLPATAQPRRRPRRRAAPPAPLAVTPEIDPAPRPGVAPMADRRFPSPEQVTRPGLQVVPGIPTARSPTRGSTFADRDVNFDSLGRGSSPIAEPGLSIRVPFLGTPGR